MSSLTTVSLVSVLMLGQLASFGGCAEPGAGTEFDGPCDSCDDIDEYEIAVEPLETVYLDRNPAGTYTYDDITVYADISKESGVKRMILHAPEFIISDFDHDLIDVDHQVWLSGLDDTALQLSYRPTSEPDQPWRIVSIEELVTDWAGLDVVGEWDFFTKLYLEGSTLKGASSKYGPLDRYEVLDSSDDRDDRVLADFDVDLRVVPMPLSDWWDIEGEYDVAFTYNRF